MDDKKRCTWCNLKNPIYIEYHDTEWCVPNFDDRYLYEMLLLESFQAGLSWECVLNKRDGFRKAYDHFDLSKVVFYDKKKMSISFSICLCLFIIYSLYARTFHNSSITDTSKSKNHRPKER